ncbi:MAG: type II secretion system F family protein [Aquiluna sp.]|nr:type II secretion system F family protein [Aquiluna sp.]MCF8546212.1 type II secretion system F family protein [Aquiluna sp.]
MRYAILVAVGLAVALIFLAIFAERSRMQRERRLNLLLSSAGEAKYQDPLDRAVSQVGQNYRNFQNRLTDRFFIITTLNDRLFYADLRMGVISLALLSIAASLVLTFFFWTSGLDPLGGFGFAAAITVSSVWLWTSRRISTRRAAFQQQLPEFLLLLASSLRSGLSLMQSLDSVSAQGNGEIERQFRRSVREISLGLRVESALTALSKRAGSSDMDLVIAALETQREVGGNLSDVLEEVAETARDRAELAQEVRVLSSEGRISALFLTLLPIAVFVFFAIFNPNYVDVFWTEPVGILLAAVFVLLVAIGAIWMRILVRIRV